MLHSGRFAGAAPAESWATVLDEATYLGPVSTFYRVLRAEGEVRERRRPATHPAAVKPELMASAPGRFRGVVIRWRTAFRRARDLGAASAGRQRDRCQDASNQPAT